MRTLFSSPVSNFNSTIIKMFILKFLLIFTCCGVYGLDSKKKDVSSRSTKGKIKSFSALEENLRSFFDNITLVGSQNIYGSNGELLEIRTIELHLPTIPAKEKLAIMAIPKEIGDEDDTTIGRLEELRNQISAIGFDLAVDSKQFDKEGELASQTYIKDDLYYDSNYEQQRLNRTIEVESFDVVEEAVADLKGKHKKVSVHMFNDELHLIAKRSNIVPEFAARIIYSDQNRRDIDEMLKGASHAFVESFEDLDNGVPSKFADYLRSRYNSTDFYVLRGDPQVHFGDDTEFGVTLENKISTWNKKDVIDYTVYKLKTE